jgi:uncharacterized membrane protein
MYKSAPMPGDITSGSMTRELALGIVCFRLSSYERQTIQLTAIKCLYGTRYCNPGGFFEFVLKLLPAHAVPRLLFGGPVQTRHKTKFAFKEIVDRYKSSIDDVNSSLTFSVGLAVIALYSYFALPASGEVSVSFVGIKISRQLWISVVPAIAYGLQVFGLTSFIWFMLLRIGLRLILIEHTGSDDDYGDVTNICLKGPLGHLWIALRIKEFYKSTWNYLWYLPLLTVVLIIFMSPLLVCSFFVRQFFRSGNFVLGFLYGGLLIPYLAFFILLVCTAAILGMGENTVQIEDEIAKKAELASIAAALAEPRAEEEHRPKESQTEGLPAESEDAKAE